MESVWIVWDTSDYYTDIIIVVCATKEEAEGHLGAFGHKRSCVEITEHRLGEVAEHYR